MINKKNIYFLTLFSLVLVLSVYYITMPSDLLLSNNDMVLGNDVDKLSNEEINVEEGNVIDVLKAEDMSDTLCKINELKDKIASKDTVVDDKNKAIDEIKLLNQISSKEEIIEEKIKLNYDLNSFVKIDNDQVRVVIDSDNQSKAVVNNIMKTIQNNFDTKKYISVQFR